MKVAVALVLVVFAGGPACTAARGCTDVGGFEGVGAELPRALFVPTGEAAFEVCDADGCASASQRLGPVPEGPVGRGVSVTFDELGLIFVTLERTALASIPACLLAPAVMPARGPVPRGTQRERVPTDRQL